VPNGMEQGGAPQGANPAELVQGVVQAAQIILEGVSAAEGVPPEAKDALAQATQQYVGVLSQIVGGGQGGGAPQPRQAESMPGGRPLTPSGV
jgi:hypothetical protein